MFGIILPWNLTQEQCSVDETIESCHILGKVTNYKDKVYFIWFNLYKNI